MIRTVAQTGSTNEDMAALARQGGSEGEWLRAERQTGGKGRSGRHWLSPPGNLYASTIIALRQGDPPPPSLALVAAIALHEAAIHYAESVVIKWPNDLVADGAKLAGILLEREGDKVIAGFGVNLAACPEIPDRPVTSLEHLTGSAPDPADFLAQLVESLTKWVAVWRDEGVGAVCRAWLVRAHPLGTPLVTSEGAGRFDGLEADGALRLRLADGTSRVIHAGDVFLV